MAAVGGLYLDDEPDEDEQAGEHRGAHVGGDEPGHGPVGQERQSQSETAV